MKPASLAEIRKELKVKSSQELAEFCLRLARFKKDNKELLTYLLFDQGNEQAYIEEVKYFIDDQIEEVNQSHIYYAKKGLNKLLRQLNKFIRYSGKKQTELEVLIHFCQSIQESGIPIQKSSVLTNMYARQINKIEKALNTLHEDLKADFQSQIENL